MRWYDRIVAFERPSSAFLLVEVANTTLDEDLEKKVPLHARARFPEVWVIDVKGEQAWVFRTPELGHYRDIKHVERDGTLTVSAFPDVTVLLRDLLPPR